MLITHKLRKGETFATVAKKYRVTDWKKSWDLKSNKALKAKRKTPDRVEPGDGLTLIDPSAKLYTVDFLGKTYLIPEDEWTSVAKAIVGVMKKQFLPKLLKTKKIYDDDYAFMWEIANSGPTMIGLMASIVEDVTGAKVPTREMSAVSAAVLRVEKSISAGHFARIVVDMGTLDTAIAAYVKASEDCRRKMTKGSTVTLEVVTTTRDTCFLLAGALASGALVPLATLSVTATEIGMLTAMGTALIKAGSDEVGEHLAGTKRTGGQIAYHMVRDMCFAATTSLLGAGLRESKFGKAAIEEMTKGVIKFAPKAVERQIAVGSIRWLGTFDQLGEKAIADVVAKTIARLGTSWYFKTLTELVGAKEFADEFIDAAKKAAKSMNGKETAKQAGEKIAKAMAESGILERTIAVAINDSEKAIKAALEKKMLAVAA